MSPSIRPATLGLVATFLATYHRGAERYALRDFADDRREFRALIDAWEAVADEPMLTV